MINGVGLWPPGLYGTDASGGKWGSYPELRRCGCGVSKLASMDPPFEIEFGASFALPGDVQTVPRAELFAITLLAERVSHGVLYVVSDSSVNVNMYHQGTKDAFCRSTPIFGVDFSKPSKSRN